MKKERKKKLKPYATSRIKTRNFLSNISYAAVTKEDFHTDEKLNPFLLDPKLPNQDKHEIINMLWKECVPTE